MLMSSLEQPVVKEQLVPLLEQPIAKQQSQKVKRNDIQLLRFLAIAAVLGFHLRPKSVPQGYLGVDIFFVISGYLMTVVTASSKGAITMATVTRFYERRLKRLCPVYLLTILGTLIAGSVLLVETDFVSLQLDSVWALAFGTNIQAMLKNDDYFQFGSDYKFLLHTWSLSVEMQFYAVAPFVLALIARSTRPILASCVLIGLSLAFQSFVPSAIWSFDCVLSRIWQFLIGTTVFYMEKRHDSNKAAVKKMSTTTLIISIVVIITLLLAPKLSQNMVYEIAVRVVATLLTAFIMYFATLVDEVMFLKPVMRVLTLLGNASYSIYLIHWPMIRFAKYVEIFDSMEFVVQVLCILAVAIIQYYVIEKPLISFTTLRVFVICIVLYCLTLRLTFLPSKSGFIDGTSVTNVSLMEMDPLSANLQLVHNCLFDQQVASLNCSRVAELDAIVPPISAERKTLGSIFCGVKGPGKWTIFVTGNSFAQYQMKAVQKALKGQYKMLYLAARPHCIVFDGMNDISPPPFGCDESIGLTDKILQRVKPDMMVIIQRLNHNKHFESGKVGNVSTVQYLEKVFANFSKHTRKIFVVEPNANVDFNVPNSIAKALKFGYPLDGIFVTLKEYKSRIDKSMNQVVAAMKSCPKCEPIWIRQHLCDAEKCNLYDRRSNLTLYCDASHLSTIGSDLIVPAFRVALEKGLRELRSLVLSRKK